MMFGPPIPFFQLRGQVTLRARQTLLVAKPELVQVSAPSEPVRKASEAV